MARKAGTFVENQFVQGLITEATGLNFPEKAVQEAWNTRFGQNGEVTRRLGIDLEEGNPAVSGDFRGGASRSYQWANPSRTDSTFLVQQAGRYISFFKPSSTGSYSTGLTSFVIDLTDYTISGGNIEARREVCDFSSADGKLFITHALCDPIYVEYDEDTDTFTATSYILKVRDTEGVDDGLEPGERPASLSNKHKYNLWNQGWWEREVRWGQNERDYPLTAWGVSRWGYPSNAEIWWYYKGVNSNGIETFTNDNVNTIDVGNTEAPKGHFIYNAFKMDRKTKTGISGVPTTSSEKRPTCTAQYAGRIWYAGVDDRVLYSQVVENETTYGKCYQKNDPTSELLSDLLDTDGGVIRVLGLGKATGLFSGGSNLYIFSSKGIWVISGSGSEGTGFVATDFAVRRISSVGLVSSLNLLDVEGSPIWWNLEGIWTIQIGPSGAPSVTSLSNDTIKHFLSVETPVQNRGFSQGAFNQSARTVQWLFKSTEPTSYEDSFNYDRILELNLTTGAFYPFSWDVADCALSSIYCVTGVSQDMTSSGVVTDSSEVTVTDAGGADVTTTVDDGLLFQTSLFKYTSVGTDTIAILEEVNTEYEDFTTLLGTGVSFSSYFTSGVKVHGEGRDGTIEYITVYTKEVNDGSIKLQTKWDWSNSQSSGKWSQPQECYTVQRNNRDISRKRLLVRGSGPAVQLSFSSVDNKPFNLLGWGTMETFDAVP